MSFARLHDKKIGKGINIKKLNNILKTKGFKNYGLIKGDVTKTIDQFIKNKNLKYLYFTWIWMFTHQRNIR